MTGKVDVGILTYSRETCHGTQVVKIHDWRDLLTDCCMRAFDKSPEVNQWKNKHNSNLIFLIQLNMVALEQSESSGHGHFPFYPIAYSRIYQFIRPRDPSHHEKQEGRGFCPELHFHKQWIAWWITLMMEHIAKLFEQHRETIGNNTLWMQLVLPGVIAACDPSA